MLRQLAKASGYHLLSVVPLGRVRKLDLLVCSPGGVATTMLLETFGGHLAANDPYDRDHLKHLPRPFPWHIDDLRVIYVVAHPVQIAASLVSRDFFRLNCSKHGQFFPPHLDPTLEDVASASRDWLNLNHLFHRWLSPGHHHNPCLVVDFECLWSCESAIRSFCGVDGSGWKLPERRERATEVTTLDTSLVSALESKYSVAVAMRDRLLELGGHMFVGSDRATSPTWGEPS